MEKKFDSIILKKQLFNKQHSLLLAISGGVDSVVLAYLLKKSGFNFSLAHCNFKLRAKDSDADELFCKSLSKTLNVNHYSRVFNVETYCKKNKVSIQMAARNLRYEWFDELMRENKLDYLLTAHHANDTIETFFINLCRGTGINGLKGIAEKNGKIIRPLLNFTKEEILTYAQQEKIKYRTDKSNLEAKYERNFLRLNVIPKLKELHPNTEQTLLNNIGTFKEEAEIINDFLIKKSKHLLSNKGTLSLINKLELQKEKYLTSILHHLLVPFNFNLTQINNIKNNLLEKGEVGKLFFTSTHSLTIDRDYIVIKPNEIETFSPIKINSVAELKKLYLINVSVKSNFSIPKNNELIIEKEKLIYPLIIRRKKNGDKFIPFGMKGFKLVSNFLKDEKVNAFDKEKCLLLENGNGDIIWLIGYRSDERYRVNHKATKFLKLTLVE